MADRIALRLQRHQMAQVDLPVQMAAHFLLEAAE